MMEIQHADDRDSPPRVPFGFSTSRISPFSEVPDIVIPSKYTAFFTVRRLLMHTLLDWESRIALCCVI